MIMGIEKAGRYIFSLSYGENIDDLHDFKTVKILNLLLF